MPRVQIQLPEHFPVRLELPLFRFHINVGDHADNVQLLTFVAEGRYALFQHFGYTETDIEGIGTVLADAAVQYRSEAFHGETLVVEAAPGPLTRSGGSTYYRVSDKATGREVLRAKNGFAFFDYAQRKTCPVPDAFRRKWEAAMQG